MKNIYLLIFLITFAACNAPSTKNNQNQKKIVLTEAAKKHLIIEGESLSKQVAVVLQKNLKSAIKNHGIDGAIGFCHGKAISLTDSVAKAHHVTIRRSAKKFRNPFNETSKLESDVYKQYVLDWLGNKPLKPQIIVDKNGRPVYYGLIKLNKKVCLQCHGLPGKDMPVEREKRIKQLYPGDKAVNFKFGQPRGMWVITFPEYKVEN